MCDCHGPARYCPDSLPWEPEITPSCSYCDGDLPSVPVRRFGRSYCCAEHLIADGMGAFEWMSVLGRRVHSRGKWMVRKLERRGFDLATRRFAQLLVVGRVT